MNSSEQREQETRKWISERKVVQKRAADRQCRLEKQRQDGGTASNLCKSLFLHSFLNDLKVKTTCEVEYAKECKSNTVNNGYRHSGVSCHGSDLVGCERSAIDG
jgi:hypothetical protein